MLGVGWQIERVWIHCPLCALALNQYFTSSAGDLSESLPRKKINLYFNPLPQSRLPVWSVASLQFYSSHCVFEALGVICLHLSAMRLAGFRWDWTEDQATRYSTHYMKLMMLKKRRSFPD